MCHNNILEQIREQKRNIERSCRAIEREKRRVEADEKKMKLEIKKMAKAGQHVKYIYLFFRKQLKWYVEILSE